MCYKTSEGEREKEMCKIPRFCRDRIGLENLHFLLKREKKSIFHAKPLPMEQPTTIIIFGIKIKIHSNTFVWCVDERREQYLAWEPKIFERLIVEMR